MRKLQLLCLVGTIWITAGAQVKIGREQDGLSGRVQTVTTETAEFTTKDGKSIEGPRMRVQTITYDARGNKIKRVDLNRDGSIAQTLVYIYDKDGRNFGYEDYVAGMSKPRRHIYTLDQNGNRTEYRIIQPDGKDGDEKYVYKYDGNGNRISEELYYKTSLISRNENTYDDHGRLISQTSYNPDASISSRIRVSFAPDGKPVERTRHDGDLLTYRVRYTYDSKRRLVQVETVGSYVETDGDSENYITGKVVYVYKGNARPKEMLIHNQDGSLRERVVLDYDSRGNWTKRTHRVKATTDAKEVTRQIDYRKITYF